MKTLFRKIASWFGWRRAAGLVNPEAETRMEIPVYEPAPVAAAAGVSPIADAAIPQPVPGDHGDSMSATRWFMAAVDPSQITEGEALDYSTLDDMTDRYRSKGELPDDLRKSFSLDVD